MHLIHDILLHFIRDNFHKFLIISLPYYRMYQHQSLYPLYLTIPPNFLNNDLHKLIFLLLIFTLLPTFFVSPIDVNVNLIVDIVMDVDIYVNLLTLGFWTRFHTLLSQLDQRFRWYHIMCFIDFACREELLDFGRTHQSTKHCYVLIYKLLYQLIRQIIIWAKLK